MLDHTKPYVEKIHYIDAELAGHVSYLSLQDTDECDMKTVMCSHLDPLISRFEKKFSEDMEKHNLIRNPFVDNANAPQGFTSLEAEQLIDLSFDPTLKSIYNPNSLISFWVEARSEFPLVGSCSWAVCNVILV